MTLDKNVNNIFDKCEKNFHAFNDDSGICECGELSLKDIDENNLIMVNLKDSKKRIEQGKA